eukprot:9941951-Ditylum_brightwellii.AAC.1
MMEVQLYRISKNDLYEEFGIDPLENIMVSCQLHWIGKIACMDEKRLPRKFLTAWHIHPRPVGCPQRTIRHTYLHTLRLAVVLEDLDKARKTSDWMPRIQDNPKEWDTFAEVLRPT